MSRKVPSRTGAAAVGAGLLAVASVLTLPAGLAYAATTTQPAWYVDSTLTNPSVASGATLTRQAFNVDGRGVGVALIDTGVAPVPGLPASRVVNGPDLSFESQSPTLRYLDTNGHGTHMAGIIAGNDTAAGYTGIAPGAKITSVKVGTADGAVDVSQVIAGIDWVVAHRNDDTAAPIKVINLSYGTDSLQDYKTDPLNFAVENAWKAGIVVVVAGGNTGVTNRLTSPATDPYVLSVGSVNARNVPMDYRTVTGTTVSSFSASTTGRRVDIAAPGESIVSLRNPGSYVDTTYPTARVGDALFKGSGTSQATAVVSGVVALMLQKTPSMTPDKVKTYLQTTGSPISNLSPADAGIKMVNTTSAVALTMYPATTQSFAAATGTGTLEAARGTSHVVDAAVPLSGERTVVGPFTSGTWAAASKAKTSWQGGLWMGQRLAGDGWTGTSWASRTWASAVWTGTSWSSSAWTDTAWSGRAWSGRAWSGAAWTGRYWSSSQWSSIGWSA
ncbi:MAG: serine protease AprX [Micromonosporaceae bacterium]|nr:serine protease AprX [Micromonosporaceae bacterium]